MSPLTKNNGEQMESTKFMRVINEEEDGNSSSSSSSIGKNSDDEDDNESDAESTYKCDHGNDNINMNMMRNESIDDAIQAIEEALPMRRGISTFYNGKSKSFTCLANVWPSSTPSIKDIAKPENAYTRKRRNLLASTLLSTKNKNRVFQLSNISNGRISKKPKSVAPRVALEAEDPKPLSLKKQNLSSMRSFSMVNLNVCSSRFGLNSTGIENC